MIHFFSQMHFPFPCIYPQTVTSCCVQTFAICDMLRFDFCRASFQIRLFPQCTGAFSRIHFQSKQHGFIGPSNLNQRPTFLRTISSFKESKADMLDDSYTRKWKKLLEPSHFDGAVTFEEAFGRKVHAQIFIPCVSFLKPEFQGVSAQLWPAQVTRLLQSLSRR